MNALLSVKERFVQRHQVFVRGTARHVQASQEAFLRLTVAAPAVDNGGIALFVEAVHVRERLAIATSAFSRFLYF